MKISTPNIDGIKAVTEDTSINPHNPIRIKEIEFIKFAVFVALENLRGITQLGPKNVYPMGVTVAPM